VGLACLPGTRASVASWTLNLNMATPSATAPCCRRCGNPLDLLAQPTACPNCGLQYDPTRPETYTTHRGSSRWKFWVPGFLLSVAVGTLSYALCLRTGSMGTALFFAVPVSFGAILGYATRVQTWAFVALGTIAICSVVFALVSLNLAGIFCGFTLGVIFLIPTFVGLICGVLLRLLLIAGGWDHAWYFRWYVWLIAALPLIGQQIENLIPRGRDIAVVKTGLTIDATPQEAWNALMFYEEVQHSPPWLLHLALPKPIRSEGNKHKEGEVIRCFYDCGTISKRISKVQPVRRLSFEVVDVQMRSENYASLRDGSFEIEPVGTMQCRITLTTRFERKLRPAWVWAPIERKVIHTLHGHVLEGIRRKAAESRAQDKRPAPDRPDTDPQLAPDIALAERSLQP
jgi:hypothetical protein